MRTYEQAEKFVKETMYTFTDSAFPKGAPLSIELVEIATAIAAEGVDVAKRDALWDLARPYREAVGLDY